MSASPIIGSQLSTTSFMSLPYPHISVQHNIPWHYFLAAEPESLGLENVESSELMKAVERFSQPTDLNGS